MRTFRKTIVTKCKFHLPLLSFRTKQQRSYRLFQSPRRTDLTHLFRTKTFLEQLTYITELIFLQPKRIWKPSTPLTP